MTHDELRDLTAAYALDALDALEPQERAALEAHLSGCDECRAAVASYREVASAFAQGAPKALPRDGAALRHRIVMEARTVRPLMVERSSRRWTSTPWLAAAACLTIALAIGAAYRGERARLARVEGDVARLQSELARRDSAVAAFFGPEVHVVSLSAPEKKPAMRVYWNHTRQIFIVTAFDVPAPPPGKTYQLWAMRKGQAPLSMGTFDVDAAGHALALVPVPKSIQDGGFVDDCALTVEPAGGSAQPTEAPRLVGTWRHVD